MGIIGMVLSVIAIVAAIAWGTLITKAGKNIAEPLNLETCDEVLVEMEKSVKELSAIKDKGDDAGMGDISTMLNASTRIAKIQTTANELECNQDSTFKAKMDALADQM